MSIDLILEVMDHAPTDLTSGERLTLIVIAERANDKTRVAIQSTRWNLDTIAHRVGIKRSGLKAVFQGLAKKECEVRVPVKHDKAGKPVFAFEGTAMTFKLPKFAERGGHSTPSTERGDHDHPSSPREGWPQHPRGETVASERGDHSHPQSLMTLKEPSKNSLSGELPSVPAPCDPGEEDRERDGSTSSSNPKLPWKQRLVVKHGCPEHLAEQVVDFIEATNTINGPGWWHRLDGNSTLADQVELALTGLARCVRCEGTGEVWSETFGTMVRCDSCHTGPTALDWQPRSSDPRFRAPAVNVPEGTHTAAWERRRQQHTSAGERKYLRAQAIGAELDAELGIRRQPGQHQPYRNPIDPSAYDAWQPNAHLILDAEPEATP